MDFTKGEISELKLRLIAFATDSGPLIAGIDVCDKQTRRARGGDKPEQLFQNFTLGEIYQRCFPITGYSFTYYALERGGGRAMRDDAGRAAALRDATNAIVSAEAEPFGLSIKPSSHN